MKNTPRPIFWLWLRIWVKVEHVTHSRHYHVELWASSCGAQTEEVQLFNGALLNFRGGRGSASQSIAHRHTRSHVELKVGPPLTLRRPVVLICFFGGVGYFLQFLPGGNASGTYEEANKDDNKEKNRYPNILPCEHTFCSVGTRAPFDSELAASCMCAHVLFFFF